MKRIDFLQIRLPSQSERKFFSFFEMDVNQANLKMVSQLKSGTCLYQDHLGRNQPITIDVLFDSLAEDYFFYE
ncbi:hypothetical protein D929_01688 [Enterococcus faecalis 02-MB-P-10]|nr:hypothetical protein D929_01688 [Enterococcus faecalis 02-MB-P-10]